MNTTNPQPAFEELLSAMESSHRYDHLKIIFSRNNKRSIGQSYLMITRNGFQVVRLNGVDHGEKRIILELEDIQSGETKKITIDVEDREFRFLLISWQDIRRMVLEENNSTGSEGDDKLLDFEFGNSE